VLASLLLLFAAHAEATTPYHFRLGFGAGVGPVAERYQARYAVTANDVQPLEVYAFQETASGLDISVCPSGGYVLSEKMEVEGGLSLETGSYSQRVTRELYGGIPEVVEQKSRPGLGIQALGGIRWRPWPGKGVRPMLGAGLLFQRGSSIDAHMDRDPILPDFGAPWFLGPRLAPGIEIGIDDRAVLFIQIPVAVLPIGRGTTVHDEGEIYISDKEVPIDPTRVFASIQVGFQWDVRALND